MVDCETIGAFAPTRTARPVDQMGRLKLGRPETMADGKAGWRPGFTRPKATGSRRDCTVRKFDSCSPSQECSVRVGNRRFVSSGGWPYSIGVFFDHDSCIPMQEWSAPDEEWPGLAANRRFLTSNDCPRSGITGWSDGECAVLSAILWLLLFRSRTIASGYQSALNSPFHGIEKTLKNASIKC